MKILNLKVLSLIFFVTLLVSCKKDDVVDFDTTYIKTGGLPSNVTVLYETRGDIKSDTIWVYLHGGPVIERSYDLNEKDESTGKDLFPFFTDDLIIYPYQIQHINTTIATGTNFTFENAKAEANLNAEIVKRVMEHFKKVPNKVVYLIGHSYGAFIVHDVLAKYGQIARKTISLNGRLDMDQVVWEGFSRGETWLFDAQGKNPSFKSKNASDVIEQNMSKLSAGLGFNRYTKKLANTDLSDVIFLHATNDNFVGDYTVNASDFVAEKSESNLEIEGGHGTVFDPSNLKSLYSKIIDK